MIFNIPLQENFLQATIKSIMDGNLEKSEDGNGRIDDSKIPELTKKDDSKSNSVKESEKNTEDDTSKKDSKQKDTDSQKSTNKKDSNTNNQRSNRG